MSAFLVSAVIILLQALVAAEANESPPADADKQGLSGEIAGFIFGGIITIALIYLRYRVMDPKGELGKEIERRWKKLTAPSHVRLPSVPGDHEEIV
ncbi:hypothetical protein HDU93_001968 [Gonapodya sp. JEL0774]|nr:hypothetical protein HDU93_001968 [Gonapodya sp. JEL0774]